MIVDGASVYGSTSGEGKGSRVKIDSGDLRLVNSGRIESAAFGPGQAGELEINASRVSIVGEGEWFDPKDVDAEPSGKSPGADWSPAQWRKATPARSI